MRVSKSRHFAQTRVFKLQVLSFGFEIYVVTVKMQRKVLNFNKIVLYATQLDASTVMLATVC